MKNSILLILCLTYSISWSTACTIFTAAMNGEVLAAGNEDYENPFVRVWFNPPSKERYGSVCFGFPDLQAQQAMNEHGLFFDFTAQEGIDPSKLNLKNPYHGDLFFEILGKCKNIDEVLAYLKDHDYTYKSQATVADATGRSLVINAGIIVEKTGAYQVNTNFNIGNLKGHNYNCWRYDLADKELSETTVISVDYFKKLLKQTHQQGQYGTMYSNIYDLKRGLIYVYLYRNFDEVYTIDLKNELKKGYRIEQLASHFKTSAAYEEVVKNHPEYKREQLLHEINQNGLEATLARYDALKKTDQSGNQKIDETMIDAGINLIIKAYNKHTNGGAWPYWYNFPTSYAVWNAGDDLKQPTRIFEWLLESKENNAPGFFYEEMLGYLYTMQGSGAIGRDFYKKVIAKAPKDSGNYRRAAKMLAGGS